MTEDNSDDDWTNYSSAQYGTGENTFEEDENNKKRVESKNALESYIYTLIFFGTATPSPTPT